MSKLTKTGKVRKQHATSCVLINGKTRDEIIIEKVQLYPDNLQYAFKEAADILSIRQTSVHGRYYNVLKKNKDLINTTGSIQGFTHNQKNNKVNINGDLIRSKKLKPVHIMIKDLLLLSDEDRKIIYKLLKAIK